MERFNRDISVGHLLVFALITLIEYPNRETFLLEDLLGDFNQKFLKN